MLHLVDLAADVANCLGGLRGKLFHLLRHHRKPLARLAGAGCLDCGIEREQVCLLGDGAESTSPPPRCGMSPCLRNSIISVTRPVSATAVPETLFAWEIWLPISAMEAASSFDAAETLRSIFRRLLHETCRRPLSTSPERQPVKPGRSPQKAGCILRKGTGDSAHHALKIIRRLLHQLHRSSAVRCWVSAASASSLRRSAPPAEHEHRAGKAHQAHPLHSAPGTARSSSPPRYAWSPL